MENKQEEMQATQECFLCALDPHHTCHTPQLEGRLIAINERKWNGEYFPILILDTGTAHAEIYLESHYYRKLINELKIRGDLFSSYNIHVHIYHLPNAPATGEVNGQLRYRYRANSYTLAVLEPDILLNITDLNQADYCSRQYLLRRMTPSTTSPATVRGNIVHHCFKELLKEQYHTGHQREQYTQAEKNESALAIMQRHLAEAITLNQIDLALADISVTAIQEDVLPHLESIAHWYESERNTLWDIPNTYVDEQQEGTSHNQVRAETFLLAPEIGLRGRLDLFWQQAGRQRLLELKTGGAKGDLPKNDHRWQVHGYHALLTVRRNSKMKKALATLLYSGTPGQAQAYGIPATIREIQRVNEKRNTLILNRVTSIPSAPPGYSRCSRCAILDQCQTVSALLDWQEPILETPEKTEISSTPTMIAEADRAFFAKYYGLLQKEDSSGILQQAQLWHSTVTDRIERGAAIQHLQKLGEPTVDADGWKLTFRCQNTSELRDGDEILLSDGNPITGEVVSGTITQISPEQVTVWTRELIAQPQLIDRYDNELVHIRTLQNLLRWHYAPSHLRDLVAGRIRPRFIANEHPSRTDFNVEQNMAVARAVQMQDYLLIHGPPGTGKTSVIAEIVKRLTEQGQRVMLAGFTNQAVDNMLKRLSKEGIQHYLRLGHERSVDVAIHPYLLKAHVERIWAQQQQLNAEQQRSRSYADIVQDVLLNTAIVASTTATWSSDKYIPRSAQPDETSLNNPGLAFDVAIIDEAGQLTIPAILGALRFAKRFILVGDEKQLPPLVLNQQAIAEGLAESLFSYLKKRDEIYIQEHPLAISACVALRTQYRMNKWISHFASRVFYEQLLQPHASVANRRLHYPNFRLPLQPQERIHTESQQMMERALDPRYPLVFLDVRGEVSHFSEQKYSNAEALAIRQVVAQLLARGIAQKDIGIIAPFRAQVATIRRHLFSDDLEHDWQALPIDTQLSVDTVDRFQGGERLVILMSFATSHEPSRESQRRQFLINANRLNVALTRAQCKLILVGCVPALENLPTFDRLIAYCRSMNTMFSFQSK